MIDHELTDELVCPYCGYEFSDSWECGEDSDDYQCEKCSKRFVYTSDTTRTFTSSKADCLNGAPHDWKYSPIFGPEYPDAKYCRACRKHQWKKDEPVVVKP